MRDEEIRRLILDACYQSYLKYDLGKTLHSGMLATLLDISPEDMKRNVKFLAEERDYIDAHRLLTSHTHYKIVLNRRGIALIQDKEKYDSLFPPVPQVRIYFKDDVLNIELPHKPKYVLEHEERKAVPIVEHLSQAEVESYLKNILSVLNELSDPQIDITDKEEAKSLVHLIQVELTKPEINQNIKRIRNYLEKIVSFSFAQQLPKEALNALWEHFR